MHSKTASLPSSTVSFAGREPFVNKLGLPAVLGNSVMSHPSRAVHKM